MKSPSSNFLVLGNVRHFEFSLENRCSKCFRSHKAYCVTMAQNEQLIIFYSLQRKDRIKEQFCYKRRDLIKRSQITFKNTTSKIFFQIPFILCSDYIRQQVRIDCSSPWASRDFGTKSRDKE